MRLAVDLAACKGRRVHLYPARAGEYEECVWSWLDDFSALGLWQGMASDRNAFQDRFKTVVAAGGALFIRLNGNNRVVGFGHIYSGSPAGWAFFLQYLDADHRRPMFAAESTLLILALCFGPLGLRKVYADVSASNDGALRSLLTAGFVREGLFREHVLAEERLWDCHRLAMTKEAWTVNAPRFARLVDVQAFIDDVGLSRARVAPGRLMS